MNQEERRRYLLEALVRENPAFSGVELPGDEGAQRRLLRGLMNIRPPREAEGEFLRVQDAYLQERLRERGVTRLQDLRPAEDGLYLWRGDATTLACGAIVNAANGGMTGCYQPCHGCIDNCIHTYAGVQLRLRCAQIMARQGHDEPPGRAKITPAFNLPCRYVIHTVGPVVQGALTPWHEETLARCYRACLALADEYGVGSVALCCIATGVFGFPQEAAAHIAVGTVRRYLAETGSKTRVIFNVYTQRDEKIYLRLLGGH
ncbi:MAG: protein-ADP-ribose hydrolase [Aristaeellaceae bacterium]